MSYIGNTPAENYASFLTETFSVSATANYTLSHAVSNENDIRLVINNVVQQPGSGKAYTASGTTLTLTSATASGDVMYAVYLGRALQTVNPPNASVGSAQVADSLISGKTALGATPADTDELLISDAGTLKRVDFSHLKSANTPAFEGYTTNGHAPSDATETKVELFGESFDTDSAFDTSNSRFTVPSGKGGKYYVYGNIAVDSQADSSLRYAYIRIKKNGNTNLIESYYNFTDNNPRDVAILVHGTLTLSAGDYIELWGYMDDTANSGLEFKGASGTRLATLMGGYKLIGV